MYIVVRLEATEIQKSKDTSANDGIEKAQVLSIKIARDSLRSTGVFPGHIHFLQLDQCILECFTVSSHGRMMISSRVDKVVPLSHPNKSCLGLLLFFSTLSISISFAPSVSFSLFVYTTATPPRINWTRFTNCHVYDIPSRCESTNLSRLTRKAYLNDDENVNKNSASRISIARAGGRSRNINRRLNPTTTKDWIQKITTRILLPWFLVFLLLRGILSPFLFSTSSSYTSPSYVYYQKSIYESSSYNSESGQVERTRKESFRSNIPSLISGQQLQQTESRNSKEKYTDESNLRKSRISSSSSSSYMFDEDPDDVFERELDMFFPRTLFDDFF